MENRARHLKTQKKKATKRSGRKPLLKKLANYFKGETFMYAPLLSPTTPDFPSPDNLAKVVEVKKPRKESRCFMEQVGDYLKSDVYMYAPLLHPPPPSPEPLQPSGMNSLDASPRRLTMKINQKTDHIGNENQRCQSHLPQTDLSEHHTMAQKETVKHTVYQSCRPAAASRNVTINTQLKARRVIVD